MLQFGKVTTEHPASHLDGESFGLKTESRLPASAKEAPWVTERGDNLHMNEDGEISRGMVRNLYTFGAPHVAIGHLENPLASDGCFPGMRVVNKDKALVYHVDVGPTLLTTTAYDHPRIHPVFLYQDGTSEKKDCGWHGRTYEMSSFGLHLASVYIRRSAAVEVLRDVARVSLAVSYETSIERVAAFVREQGFGLVASAVDRRYHEVSHLIQNPDTLDCWLTFEGSDNIGDWLNNLNVGAERFCGLGQRVHSGFKISVMHIVHVPDFQDKVRPNLGHCRSVDAVGHSLGGSIATLFTACAHSTVGPGQAGYDEYQKIQYPKKQTQRLPYL